MSSQIPPMSIKISPTFDVGYKSISNLSWVDIPGFAILTGPNGSGKTQLLEALAYSLTGAVPPEYSQNFSIPLEVKIDGAVFDRDEVGWIPSTGRFSGGSSASLANMASNISNVINISRQTGSYRTDIVQHSRSQRLEKRLRGRQFDGTNVSDFLTDEYELAIDDLDVTEGLARAFVGYRFKMLESLEKGHPEFDDSGKALGPAPWDVVNDALAVAAFPYEITSPVGTRILDDFSFKLIDRRSGKQLAPIDLSSGEKVLMQLVLWLFAAGKEGLFPKLLLLDEPDAHLHPSMTRQFLDVIAEVLVGKYGVRVIMTTHSPSTVSLAPPGSVFQMERGATAVKRPSSHAEAVSMLTAGLVTVTPATKFCLVEDKADVAFYEAVYEVLTNQGPGKDPLALKLTPSIAFIAASVGSGADKLAGGSTIVSKWVEKLGAEPLAKSFLGIIDRDVANAPADRVFVIGRYSFENYLLDPVTLYALLLEEGNAPSIQGAVWKSGDEHLLRTVDASVLQAVVNEITGRMVASDSSLSPTPTVAIDYSNGSRVNAPSWVVNMRGHDLLPIAQKALGGPQLINSPRLIKAFKRARVVPVELAKLLSDIQDF